MIFGSVDYIIVYWYLYCNFYNCKFYIYNLDNFFFFYTKIEYLKMRIYVATRMNTRKKRKQSKQNNLSRTIFSKIENSLGKGKKVQVLKFDSWFLGLAERFERAEIIEFQLQRRKIILFFSWNDQKIQFRT